MNHMRITRIVPIDDHILLLVFKDIQTEKHDAKFLVHQLSGVTPRSDPEGFQTFLMENPHVISEWESKLKLEATGPEEEAVEITLSVSENEWNEIQSTCADMNITVEQFALALIRFSVEPGAIKAIEQWYTGLKSNY